MRLYDEFVAAAERYCKETGRVKQESAQVVIAQIPSVSPDLRVLVVTDSDAILGAAAIFREDIQRLVEKELGGMFFILPSSIHEVLCMAYDPEQTEALTEIVQSINRTAVAPVDRLSDNVYMFDGKTIRECEENF